MNTKKAAKPAAKAAAKPAAKAGTKALQKRPIDLKSPEKPAATRPSGPPSPAPVRVRRPSNGAVKVGVVGCAGRMGSTPWAASSSHMGRTASGS